MSQLQKTPTAGNAPESAEDMAGNKLAQTAAEKARAALAALDQAEVEKRNQMREEAAEKARNQVRRSTAVKKRGGGGCWC